MEKIVIIGCGGAGKSTLARALGDKLDLPVVHLDKLFWRPGWVHIPREEFDALLEQELAKDTWIIDGDFERTVPRRLQFADTVIYLDFSRFACLTGVLHRVISTYGKVRPDMGEGCPERFDWEFIQWIWNYRKNKRPRIYRLLENAENVDVHILKNRRQLRRFLENPVANTRIN